MTRRLLAQLGLAAVALAATGGMALADSSPASLATDPGANQQQGGSSNVSLTTGGSVTIQNNQTSTQQVGESGPTVTDDPNSTPPTATPTDPAATVSDPTSTTTSTHPLINAADATLLPSSTIPTATPPASSAVEDSAIISNPAEMTSALHRAAAVVAAAPYPTLVRAVASSDIPQPPAPGAPHSPVGFLYQLHLMMALVVPTTQILPGLLAGTTLASILISLGLSARIGRIRRPSFSTYTARLRQSGFLGAARSDIAAAQLSFATPLEMGFIRAYAT